MKTHLKRLKYYLALGLGAVLIFSSIITVITPHTVHADCPPLYVPNGTGGCVLTVNPCQAGGSSCDPGNTNQPPSQPTSGEWVDSSHIKFDGVEFDGPQLYSGNFRYTASSKNSCGDFDFIEFSQNPTASNTPKSPGFLDFGVGHGAQDCQWTRNHSITMTNTSAATVASAAVAACYAMANPNQTTNCLNTLAQKNCNQAGGIGRNGVDPTAFDACVQRQLDSLTATVPAAGIDPGQDQAPVATDPAGNETDPELDCGTTKTKLDWIICPVVKMVNTGINALDNAIIALLSVDPQIVNESNPDSGGRYYKAWQSFRNIGMGIIVIAALIMLISQALGFDVFDAYTVKKVMPRVVLAIIGMALSWEIMKFLIVFTNDLGLGVRHLIYFPFQGVNNGNIVGGGEGVILTLIAVPAIFAMGIGILLSFAGTALLGLMVAFLVLILRQLVIVVLVLTAPIAIACYVLPNTQSLWKLWHESFSKALLMFPIIMAFLATGRVFAEVASGPTATTLSRIIAFIAYIIPYFMIPVTFRFAGGALRTVGGFVNDRSRGAFDGLKKYRGNKAKDRIARAKSQHLYNPNTRMGRIGNKIGTWATDPGSNAAYSLRKVPGFKAAGARVASQVEHARVSQSQKLFEELNKSGYNDRAYRLLSGAHDQLDMETRRRLDDAGLYGKAPQSISELQRAAHILGQSTNSNEQIAGNAIEGSMGKLATMYKDQDMGKASIQAAGIMGLAAHGFANGDDLSYVGNQLQGKKGDQRAFSQTIVSTAQLMGSRSRPDVKNGYGVVYVPGADGGPGHIENCMTTEAVITDPETGRQKTVNRADALLNSLSAQDMSGAKAGAFDDLRSTIVRGLEDTNPNRAQAVRDQLFQWASPYSPSSNDIKIKALELINSRAELSTAYQERAAQEASRQAMVAGASGGTGGGTEGGGAGAGAGGGGGGGGGGAAA